MDGHIRAAKLDGQTPGRGWAIGDHDDGFPMGQLRIRLDRKLCGDWAAGDEQIHDHGRTIWPRGSSSDYEFQHVMEFGSHSLWGWMKGAEIVVGGTIGAFAGAQLQSPPCSGPLVGRPA